MLAQETPMEPHIATVVRRIDSDKSLSDFMGVLMDVLIRNMANAL
jgi:hypothetical protein